MDLHDELVHLEIPARPAFVGIARSVIAAAASSVEGIDDDRLEDLRIAVSEACTNAVEAHLVDAIDQQVVVRFLVDDEHLEVRIEDGGPGFDPGALPVRPPVGDPRHLEIERGWGISLIRALVDTVEFHPTGAGTAVRLVMQRDGAVEQATGSGLIAHD